MRRNAYVALTAIAAVAVGVWLAYPRVDPASARELKPDNTELVREGMSIYAEHCASCHGAGLEGQANWRQRKSDGRLPAPPHDATGHTWHHPDEMLVRVTLHGPQSVAGADYVSDMPAYKGVLDEQQIVAVLSYIKSTWPREIRERHDALNAQAKR